INNLYLTIIHDANKQSFIIRMWMNVKYGIEFTPKYYKPQ
ncbi:polyamine ABC transporter substrate-binding protein, partial [Francisella tularensis subsp. holarctica]|nr:polyamine ABC transporter substrate-binding protein [Francisella tularensis subsp. holarctica]